MSKKIHTRPSNESDFVLEAHGTAKEFTLSTGYTHEDYTVSIGISKSTGKFVKRLFNGVKKIKESFEISEMEARMIYNQSPSILSEWPLK